MGYEGRPRTGIMSFLDLPRPVLLSLIAIVESYILTVFFPAIAPGYTFRSLFWRLFLVQYVLQVVYDSIIYPELLSPSRHLPRPNEWFAVDGVLADSPRGKKCLRWIKEVPNDGLIYTRSFDGSECLLVTSPEAFADVLVHRSYEFEKPYLVRRFLARFLGWALIVAEGEQHKLQRKALTPAFHVKNIRGLYPLMWEKSILLTKILSKEIRSSSNGNLELCSWTSRLTLDIIGPAAMGRDFQTLQNDNDVIATNYLELFQPSIRRLMFFILSLVAPPWFAERWPSNTNYSIKRAVDTIREVCLDVVREKKRDLGMKETAAGSPDILSTMLKGKEIHDEACVDQMLTFLAAGHETTANALAWACYLLCKHQSVQTTLRTELKEAISNPNESVSAATLEALPLLNGVCNEVLRLFPTVPLTVREVMEPIVLAGAHLAKGTWLMLCPWATNRDPALWGADAEDFNPNRWIDELEPKHGEKDIGAKVQLRPNNHGGATSNYAMLTFLHGPRSCIGQGFARAELRCAVAAMVGSFAMELQRPDEEIRSVGAVTTKPKDGLHLVMKVLEKWCEDT